MYFLFVVFRTTVSEDDDEEWGWDDTPNHSVEMSNMSPAQRKTKGSPMHHRRSESPHNSAPSSGNSLGLSLKPNSSEHKGFSVKRTGMNNPLHPPQPALQQQAQRQIPVVVAKKAPPPPPKTDDFFSELGLAAKPKFGATAVTTRAKTGRLGATALPMDDDNDLISGGGGADWDDDADLDDLLDD
jgi:hypothetical protein